MFCFFVCLYFTSVHNLQQAQGGKIVDKVMKFPFRDLNIYWVTNFKLICGWIFTHCVGRRLKRLHNRTTRPVCCHYCFCATDMRPNPSPNPTNVNAYACGRQKALTMPAYCIAANCNKSQATQSITMLWGEKLYNWFKLSWLWCCASVTPTCVAGTSLSAIS